MKQGGEKRREVARVEKLAERSAHSFSPPFDKKGILKRKGKIKPIAPPIPTASTGKIN